MVRTVGNNVSSPTTTIAGGIAGQVAYQAATNVTQFTGPGTSGQVLTSTGGAQPTFQSPAPTSNLGGGTAGQVVYQSAASTTSFTGPGTSGQFLTSNGTSAPTYTTLTTAPLATSISAGTVGQVPYQSAASTTAFTGPGTSGQILTSNGAAAPTYQTLTTVASANNITAGTVGQVVYQSSASTTSFTGPGTSGQILTSNGVAAPTFQTLGVVPVAGSIQGGNAGQVVYQAAPSLSGTTAAGTTGQVLTSAGTGAPTWGSVIANAQNVTGGSAGQLLYQQSPGVTNVTGPGTSGQFLQSNGVAAPSYTTITTVPSAQNVTGGSAGQVLYQQSPGVTNVTGPGTSGQFLKSNGGAAPTFAAVTQPTYQIFAGPSSGTYTSPAGVSSIIVEMQGAGGGGGFGPLGLKAGGGGAGGNYIKVRFAPGVYSYNTGAKGLGTNINGDNGTGATNCTFSTLIAPGGGPGIGLSGGGGGLPGTSTTTGAIQVFKDIEGSMGGEQNTILDTSNMGGASYWGTPAPRFYGLSGGTGRSRGYGAGGFGNQGNPVLTSSGDGTEGRIIVTEFY